MPSKSARRLVRVGIAASILLPLVAFVVLTQLGTRADPPAPPSIVPESSEAEPAPRVRSPGSGASSVTSADAPPSSTGPRQYRVGMQAVYDISLLSETKFELGDEMHQDVPEIHTELRGHWSVTVVGVEEEDVHFAAALGQPQFTMTPAEDRRALNATRRALAGRYYFTADSSGAVRETHFPRDLDPMARSLLKSVVVAFQMTVLDLSDDSWQAVEQTLDGEVEVAYRRLPGTEGGFARRPLRYKWVAGLSGLVPVAEVGAYTVTGSAEFHLDSEGMLIRRIGQESLRIAPDGGLMAVEQNRSARMRLLRRAEAPELARDFKRDLASLVTSTIADVERLEADPGLIDRAWVDGASLATLLAALDAAAEGKKGVSERAAIIPRLAALLRLEPHVAVEVEAAVRADAEADAARTLIAALSSAGTPEAQRALMNLGHDELMPKETRLRAVGLLGLSRSPIPESGGALVEWMEMDDVDLAETAALGLGNHLKRRREHDGSLCEADTADVLQRLIEALEVARTPEERALYLKALGNTGSPRAVPAIIAQLTTQDVSVRAAAIWALRFMPGAEVEAILVEALLADPALAPRQAVVAAAAFRSLVPLGPALNEMARSHPDKMLRLDIVHLLGVSKDRYPPGLTTLAWVAERDPAPDVRQAARNAMRPGTIPDGQLEVGH